MHFGNHPPLSAVIHGDSTAADPAGSRSYPTHIPHRAACQRPTVPVEHGRLHPRCDDSRSARSFLHHQLIRRWAVSPWRSDAPSRCLCYNLSWLLILSDSQRGSSLSPFIIWGRVSVRHQVPTRTGCLATRAEIAAPQLGLPASVLDHITLRQQEREGVKQRWR